MELVKLGSDSNWLWNQLGARIGVKQIGSPKVPNVTLAIVAIADQASGRCVREGLEPGPKLAALALDFHGESTFVVCAARGWDGYSASSGARRLRRVHWSVGLGRFPMDWHKSISFRVIDTEDEVIVVRAVEITKYPRIFWQLPIVT